MVNDGLSPPLAVGAVLLARIDREGSARPAVLDDAAARLGVEPDALCGALRRALDDELDQAVTAGHLSAAQAERVRERARPRGRPPRPRRNGDCAWLGASRG